MNENDFQSRVCDYLDLRKWAWLHLRPARTAKGWRTPVSGPLGAGWPDLICVRGDRLVAIELKSPSGRPTREQTAVLGLLSQVRHVETHLGRPADWDRIVEVLS